MTSFPHSAARIAAWSFLFIALAACSSSATMPGTLVSSATGSAICTGSACPGQTGTGAWPCACSPCPRGTPSPSATPARRQSLTPSNTPLSGFQFTPPSLVAQRGLFALTIRSGEYSHLWLWPLGLAAPSPLTSGEFDDRDPDFSPDGSLLAFSSRRDGNWELFTLDLPSGKIAQLTDIPGFHAHPSWSPDAKFIAYENYQDGHSSICILPATGGTPVWCGPDTMEAFEPDWFTLNPGRVLAFTGRTGVHTDIFTINLETAQITNLTNTAGLDERDGTFSPDGKRVAYSVKQNGYTWMHSIPVSGEDAQTLASSQGERPEWSPDGSWLAGVFQPDPGQSYLLFSPANQQVLSPAALWVPGRIEGMTWTSAALGNPMPEWILSLSAAGLLTMPTPAPAGAPLSEQLVRLDIKAPDPRLSSAVVDRFNALRQAVKLQVGWDYLGILDSAAMDLRTPLPPRELLSWFRTGRAFAISTDAVRKGLLVVVPDVIGSSEYWRLYLRAAKQDGTQGEPLRELPWDFDDRTSGTPTAFDNGGQFYAAIPQGFYIDLTQLAADFGWQRRPSDADWRSYYYSIRYWEFLSPDGLDWFTAMGELYPPKEFLTPTPSASPTARPTMRWGPAPTNTRRPTRTRTPTKTPTPTPTPP